MRMMGAILSFGFDTRHASKPVFLLNGHEVMAELGIDPGPKVGALLRSLREAEANGLVQTREEALELLAGLI
jgi:poly(A) polymerase